MNYYFAPLIASPQRKKWVDAYTANLESNFLEGTEITLRRCTSPTRIVWGTGDIVFSAQSHGYLDQLFPNSRGVRLVSGAKLFFPEEYPEIIAEECHNLWTGQ